MFSKSDMSGRLRPDSSADRIAFVEEHLFAALLRTCAKILKDKVGRVAPQFEGLDLRAFQVIGGRSFESHSLNVNVWTLMPVICA